MTVTLTDPSFLWQIAIFLFVAGGGWYGLHLSVRWLERKQDMKLAALKEVLDLELKSIRDAHDAHVERYEREHGELKSIVTGKGDSVLVLETKVPLIERRIDEKLDSLSTTLHREFRNLALAVADALGAKFGVAVT